MKAFAFIVGLSLALLAAAHGQSRAEVLNAPVPDWLSLAEPIKVEPIEGGMEGLDQSQFHSPSGRITHGSKFIQIPDLEVEFEADYPISLSNEPSLSLDGTKLLVNSTDVYLYELEDGEVTTVRTLQVPYVTYDEGAKGFISGWFLASNNVLIGYGEVEDEKGYDVLESRLYAFNTRTSSLARLDTSALEHLKVDPNYPDAPLMFDVISVGKDLSELVLSVDGVNNVRVKADLKSPHKLIQASAQEALKEPSVSGRSAIFSPSLAVRHTPPVRQPFPWLWLVAIVAVMLGVFSYLYTSRPR